MCVVELLAVQWWLLTGNNLAHVAGEPQRNEAEVPVDGDALASEPVPDGGEL